MKTSAPPPFVGLKKRRKGCLQTDAAESLPNSTTKDDRNAYQTPQGYHSSMEIGSLQGVIKHIYDNTIREYLPQKIGVFNGVAVRDIRIFDQTDVFPDYEGALVRSVREVISPGDSVVIVGGGRGVSTVIAARLAGENGFIKTIEASNEQVALVEETIEINNVSKRVDVTHALVGTARGVWGEYDEADFIEPTDLPSCDTLVLDCEGTEKEIIGSFEERPSSLVVETHGVHGAPTEEIKTLLLENEYEIDSTELVDEGYDISVLTARSCGKE